MELDSRQHVILRIGILICGCTVVLTASFVGIIAAFSGEISGVGGRTPWYVLAAASVFVATIVLLEMNDADGRTIISSSVFAGVASFIAIVFGVEGLIFTVNNPGTVFVSQLLLYFVAAALVATGVGFWGLRHWREFIKPSSEPQ